MAATWSPAGQPAAARPTSPKTTARNPNSWACISSTTTAARVRLGFAIGNEFSDHVTERRNYLLLAHSKLRQCGVGPMLNTGTLPAHLEGASRIRRDGAVIWQKPFLTGEANMCHTFANLEYHHFKYRSTACPATCTCTSSVPPR